MRLIKIVPSDFFGSNFIFAVDLNEPFDLVELVLEVSTQIAVKLQSLHQFIYEAEQVIEECSAFLLTNAISKLKPNSDGFVIDTRRRAIEVLSAL